LQVTVYLPKVPLTESAADRFARGAEKAASLFPSGTTGGCGKALLGILICPVTMAAGLILKEAVVVPLAMLVGGTGTTIQPYLTKDYWQTPFRQYPQQEKELQSLDLQNRMRERLIAIANERWNYTIGPVSAGGSAHGGKDNSTAKSGDYVLQVGIARIGFVGSEVNQDPMLEYVMEATAILSNASGKRIESQSIKYKSSPHRLSSWIGATTNPSEWDTPEPSASSPVRTISEPLERELMYSYDFVANRVLEQWLQ
jgi:hypothetical protein